MLTTWPLAFVGDRFGRDAATRSRSTEAGSSEGSWGTSLPEKAMERIERLRVAKWLSTRVISVRRRSSLLRIDCSLATISRCSTSGGAGDRERLQCCQVERGEIRGLLAVSLEPSLAPRVSVHRYEVGIQVSIGQSSPEHVVLVDAVLKLPFPDPAAPKFVTVAPFVEQNVAGVEG